MFFSPGKNPYNSKVVRFCLCITVAVAVAQGFNWTAAFIMPIFAAMLISGPRVGLKTGIGFVMIILAGGLLGLLLTVTVVHFPIVCLLVVSLLMLQIFYAGNKGLAPLAVVMLMMGVTAIPMVGIESNAAAIGLVQSLTINGVLAVVLVMIFFWLIPDSETAAPLPSPESKDVKKPLLLAFISTLVMLPMVIVFYSFSLTGALLVFVFSAILAQTPDLGTGIKGSIALIVANAVGGFFAIVIYFALVGVPEFVFLLLVMFLVSLMFASRIFSDHPYAALYASTFTTVLILTGSSLGEYSADAVENFMKRISQIMMAAFYIVFMFYTLTRLFKASSRFNKKTDDDASLSVDAGQ